MTMTEQECMNEGTDFRTGLMWHMPTLFSSGSFSDDFYEASRGGDLDKVLPFIAKCFDANYYGFGDEDEDEGPAERWQAEEQLLDAFHQNQEPLKRFIARIECPVFSKSGENRYSFSWGYYTTKYVAFNEISELIEAGEALEKEVRDKADEAA